MSMPGVYYFLFNDRQNDVTYTKVNDSGKPNE